VDAGSLPRVHLRSGGACGLRAKSCLCCTAARWAHMRTNAPAHMCSNPCTKAHLTCVAQCTIAHASVVCTFLKFCPLDANGVKMFTLFAQIYCNAIDAMIHAYKCASYVLSPLAEILQKSESQLELKSPTQLRPGALHTTPFQGSTPSQPLICHWINIIFKI